MTSSFSIYKIEQQNLNCVWDNPKLCYEYSDRFFVTEVAQDIFDTIRYLYENDVKVTVDSVFSYGNRRNPLIVRENLEYIRQQEYDVSSFEFYLKNLKKEHAKIGIQNSLSTDLFKVVTSKNELDVDKVRQICRYLSDSLDVIDGNKEGLKTIREVGEHYRGALIDRKLGNFYSYGDVSLDSVLRAGAAPGQMTTIVGATGMGKSTLALNLFSRQINKQIPAVYMSLEMDEISTMDRLVSLRKRIPTSWLYMRGDEEERGVDNDYIMSLFEDEYEKLQRLGDRFFIVDRSNLSTSDVESLIQRAKDKMGTNYLICTIDLMTMLSDCGTKPQDIEECMNRLSALAKRQNVHLINIAQIRRTNEEERVHSVSEIDRLRPRTENSIKNSGAIAERSRAVLTVFRKKAVARKLFPEDPEVDLLDDEFDVTVVKQSQGESGIVIRYLYDGDRFRLDPYIENVETEGFGSHLDVDSPITDDRGSNQ